MKSVIFSQYSKEFFIDYITDSDIIGWQYGIQKGSIVKRGDDYFADGMVDYSLPKTVNSKKQAAMHLHYDIRCKLFQFETEEELKKWRK